MLLPPSGVVLRFTCFFGGMTGAATSCGSILSAWSTSHNQYFSSPCHGHGHMEVWQLWVLFCLGCRFNTTCHDEKCQFLTSWTPPAYHAFFQAPNCFRICNVPEEWPKRGRKGGLVSCSPPTHHPSTYLSNWETCVFTKFIENLC